MEYISNKSETPLSREKLKKTRESISRDLKKRLDKEGTWKKPLESFTVSADSDFWMDVNGHDVLSAIRYKNPSAREVFINRGGYSQNRDFELALTVVYDYECLKKTNLYSKLQMAGLLKN